MELLGREEELLSFQQFLSQYPARNLIVHGPSGTGKSYFFQKLRIEPRFAHLKWIHLKILDPLAPAQSFLFDILSIIESTLSSDEHSELDALLASEFGSDFSIDGWTRSYNQSNLECGLIFHKILHLIQRFVGGKFLILIDQAENLSLESVNLLKNLIEWKPENTYFVLSLTTSYSGKGSIQRDFDHLYSFKANQYLEMKPLDFSLKDVYYSMYGIDDLPSQHFSMKSALEQKKLWLIVQCSNDLKLKKLCVFLAHFPGGIHQNLNPYDVDYKLYSAKQPLFEEIFQEQANQLFFTHIDYIESLIAAFESDYQSAQGQALELLTSQNLISQRFAKEIEINGLASEISLDLLISTYANSLSISRLQELSDASLEQAYSKELKKRLAWFQRATMINNKNFEAHKPCLVSYFNSLESQEKVKLAKFLFIIFAGIRQLKVFCDLFMSADWIALQRDFLVELLIESLRQGDLIKAEVFDQLNDSIDPTWLRGLKEIRFSLEQGIPTAIDPKEFDSFKHLAHFMNGLHAMDGRDYLKASECLQACLECGILKKDFNLHSMALTRLSECYGQRGDLDMQIRVYREAVIAEQFLA